MRGSLAILGVLVAGLLTLGQTPPPAPPAPPLTERLVRFDPQRVEVTWSRDGWSMQAGDVLLKDFGRRQTEASDAVRLIRELGLTERGTIGGPTPILEYWLVNGEAPAGTVRGQRVVSFDLASTRVESENGQHCLRDSRTVLFNFGYAKDDAEQALAVLKKYRFCRLAILGQATPTMMVFLRDTTDVVNTVGHHLSPHRMQSSPTLHHSLKAIVAEEKKAAAPPPEKSPLAGQYATPSIPALGANPGRMAFPEADPTALATSAPRMTVPGVNDRILRVPLDWRQVQLRRDPEGWMLHAGAMVLARFGTDEINARKALLAVQHYRFGEWCLVNPTAPVAHFYLVNGAAPKGEMFGVPAVTLTPEKIAIQQAEGRYRLVQGGETLLVLGDRPEDARQLLDWMVQAGVDRLCKLVPPTGGGMMFFTRR